MTLQKRQAQLRETNVQLAEAKHSEKQAALATFREQVELYEITEEELLRALGFRKVRRAAQAKYHDPSSGKNWTGRGPRPKWLKGKQLEDYLVDRTTKTWWPGE
ncbi:H-NS histone family protein [Burkholderia sp. ABCPW 14]|uniref:H-NS histone family protein n=1 Tax=Burkholderia sp. ABCPW 14 TaxID=1637860 RepID=UPI003FA43D82